MPNYIAEHSIAFENIVSDKTILGNEHFMNIVMEKNCVLKPFKDCLNKALIGYQLPKR